MKTYSFIFLFFITAILLLYSCDQTTGPGKDQNSVVQIGGCGSSSMDKSSASLDSCFSYQFHESLIADFCVSGNCCPDTNRYSTNYDITSHTITVTVEDTAEHRCHCICDYTLRAEFHDLLYDNYLFQVYQHNDTTNALLYSVNVRRF